MTKLKDITGIQSGYTFRDAISTLPNGTVSVFQAKDVLNPDTLELPKVMFGNTNHFLKDGDVLLSIRGSFRAKAIMLHKKSAIAASSVMVLRPISSDVYPEYLALFLNSPHGQDMLRSIATGAAIKSITTAELQDTSIPLPPLKTQRMLCDLFVNIITQQKVLNSKEQYLSAIFNSTINRIAKEQTNV